MFLPLALRVTEFILCDCSLFQTGGKQSETSWEQITGTNTEWYQIQHQSTGLFSQLLKRRDDDDGDDDDDDDDAFHFDM